MSSWPAVPPAPLGTIEEVQGRLAELFPQASWQWFGKTCFGRSRLLQESGIEFQVTPDEDGLCRFVTVRRVTRSEIERLCRALDVVAVDDQKVELIR